MSALLDPFIDEPRIAYFSMEIALRSEIPTYGSEFDGHQSSDGSGGRITRWSSPAVLQCNGLITGASVPGAQDGLRTKTLEPQSRGGRFVRNKEIQMSNVKMLKLALAALAASMALPALAGGWPNIPARKAVAPKAAVTQVAPGGFVYNGDEAGYSIEQYRYFTTEEGDKVYGPRLSATAPAKQAVATRSSDGFEFVAGEIGSQLMPHKLVLAGGRFTHTNECDHAIRSVMGPTPAEVDAMRSFSPGA